MAARKPLVAVGGSMQELASGDSITIPPSWISTAGASTDYVIKYTGGVVTWAPDATGGGGGGGIADAPADGMTYGRRDNEWVRVLAIDDDPGGEMYTYLMGTPDGTTLQAMLGALYWRIGFNEVLTYVGLRTNVFGDAAAMQAICESFLAITLVSLSGAKSEFKASTALTASAIPVMTTNTAPSGEASASSIYSGTYDAWKAFDGSTPASVQGYWIGANGSPDNQWVMYDFGAARYVHTAELIPGNDQPTKDFIIQYSDDNSTWEDALAGTLGSGNVLIIHDIIVPGKHRYWRFYAVNSNGPSYTSLREMQLLGFDW